MERSLESAFDELFSEERVPLIVSDVKDGTDKVGKIARVCHEVINTCSAVQDSEYKKIPWDKCPKNQVESCRRGVIFHLENPNAVGEHSHNAWMEEKKSKGWKYGPVKDAKEKTHPKLISYDKLSKIEKLKDEIFHTVVNELKDII